MTSREVLFYNEGSDMLVTMEISFILTSVDTDTKRYRIFLRNTEGIKAVLAIKSIAEFVKRYKLEYIGIL